MTPYKPSEDLEQTPLLLPPTPTSPDSTQTASGYFSESTNPSFVHSIETTINSAMAANATNESLKHHEETDGFGSNFNFESLPSPTTRTYPGSNPFLNSDGSTNLFQTDRFMHGEINDNKRVIIKFIFFLCTFNLFSIQSGP